MITDKIGPITPMDVTFEKVTESYISVWETVQGGQEVGPRPALSNLVTWSRRRGGLNMVVAAGASIKEGTGVCSTILNHPQTKVRTGI